MASHSDYRRNWELLAAVADEWSRLQQRFGWWKKVWLERIQQDVGDLLSDEASWPACRDLRVGLEADVELFGQLETCFCHRLKPEQREGFAFVPRVYEAVLLRVFWTILRNARTWLDDRRPEHKEWLRNRDTRNLTKELRRAIEDLCKAEEGDLPPDITPETPLLPPTVSYSGYASDPACDYQGRRVERPEDQAEMAELLEELCQGLSEDDARVVRRLWAKSEGQLSKEGGTAASPSDLSPEAENAILRRLTRRRG